MKERKERKEKKTGGSGGRSPLDCKEIKVCVNELKKCHLTQVNEVALRVTKHYGEIKKEWVSDPL